MRFKLRHVVTLLAALALLWAGNLWYFNANQLAKPIFLNHYYDLALYNNSSPILEFYYLVNRAKPVDLFDFGIPGHPEIRFQVIHNEKVETFSHQVLKKAQLKLIDPLPKLQPGTEIAFQEANAYFNDNTRLTAPIGQVYLASVSAPSGSPLRWSSTGSSTGNTGYTVLQANKEVEVTALHYHFQDLLGNNLHFEVGDSQAVWPFTLKQGDSFKLSYRFLFADKNDSLATSYYRIDGKLDIETADGAKSTVLTDMHYQPYLRGTDAGRLRLEREKT